MGRGRGGGSSQNVGKVYFYSELKIWTSEWQSLKSVSLKAIIIIIDDVNDKFNKHTTIT